MSGERLELDFMFDEELEEQVGKRNNFSEDIDNWWVECVILTIIGCILMSMWEGENGLATC